MDIKLLVLLKRKRFLKLTTHQDLNEISGCMETSEFWVDFFIFNPYIRGYMNLV